MKNKLYTLLKEKNVSISELSNKTGLSRTTLTALTKDDILLSKTKVGTLETIAKALNTFVCDITNENFQVKIEHLLRVSQDDFLKFFSKEPNFKHVDDLAFIYVVKLAVYTESAKKILYLSLSTYYLRFSEIAEIWDSLDNNYRKSDCPQTFSVNIMDDIDFLLLKKQHSNFIKDLNINPSQDLITEYDLIKYNLFPVIFESLGERLKKEFLSLNKEILNYYKNDEIWMPDLVIFNLETIVNGCDIEINLLPNYEIEVPFIYGYSFSSKKVIQPKILKNTILTGYDGWKHRR
ncbi:hypothetical protein ATZ33_13545 [Enterococcus silesiacus]|uniref:HTH cro/C1-type domain-containing protein n=1 Tax=Enterococcus silesiacus TaxID=332949 RepID=A0A0S3KDU1_9ENTE|nr:helix-turn-helix transcriptional regulator [Enterococcus silesiacus]ALS02372.1 hypothetical protein ATZ33_13545 [Enterococcus silesiacus]OJG91347.1 hypothetical protein RV15_GL000803 [Enterococcus silesiacus]